MIARSANRQRPGHGDLLRRVAHSIVAGLVLQRAGDDDRPGLLAGGDGDGDLDAEWPAVDDLRLTRDRMTGSPFGKMAGRAAIFGFGSSRSEAGMNPFCSGAYTCIDVFGSTSRMRATRAPAATGASAPAILTRRCAVSIGADGLTRPAGSPDCAGAGRDASRSPSDRHALHSTRRGMVMTRASYYAPR